jgi:hypothetical protein
MHVNTLRSLKDLNAPPSGERFSVYWLSLPVVGKRHKRSTLSVNELYIFSNKINHCVLIEKQFCDLNSENREAMTSPGPEREKVTKIL